jgi:uncharacterized protein (TIGR00290 family)
MFTLPKALISWSTGKDSAWALHVARRSRQVEVVGLLTTVTPTYGRVSIHGTRESILELQARALGLPRVRVEIPVPCSNAQYEASMGEALTAARAQGVEQVVFGDLFLADIREWREAQLARLGLSGAFPLWGRDTRALAREMTEAGLRALLTCLDPKVLPRHFAGSTFGPGFVERLPPGVDPCGERGEFHTCVVAGPMFREPLPVVPGEVVERDGYVYADVLPAISGD